MSKQLEQERFPSMAAFLNAVSTRQENSYWHSGNCESKDHGNSDWAGTPSFEEALDLARTGYNEPVLKMKDELNMVTKRIFKRVEHCPALPKNDYVGSTPNIVRAMNGLPRDMRRTQRKEKKRNGITLVYEGGYLSNVSTSTVLNAGMRMLSLLRLCEREQIPTRLILAFTGESDGQVLGCEIIAKDFQSVLNLNKMAYCLAHPSMLRRLKFRWLETSNLPNHHWSGYGCSVADNNMNRSTCREFYSKRGLSWFCYRDFESDDDVVRVWEQITSQENNS